MAEEVNLDDILRMLHRKLTESTGKTIYAEQLSNLIGELRHLRAGPINDIHARRLKDLLKRSISALGNMPSANDE